MTMEILSNADLAAQQERIVAAVKEWTRLSDMDAEGPRVRAAYHDACALVSRFPVAATYLLSIWYQPDDDADPNAAEPILPTYPLPIGRGFF